MKKLIIIFLFLSSCGQDIQKDECDLYIEYFYSMGSIACDGYASGCCDCARNGELPGGLGMCQYPDYSDQEIKQMDCNWIRGMCLYGLDSPGCNDNIIEQWKSICQI